MNRKWFVLTILVLSALASIATYFASPAIA